MWGPRGGSLSQTSPGRPRKNCGNTRVGCVPAAGRRDPPSSQLRRPGPAVGLGRARELQHTRSGQGHRVAPTQDRGVTWPGGWFTCVGTSSGAHLQVLTPQRLSKAFLGGQAASSACPGTLGSSVVSPPLPLCRSEASGKVAARFLFSADDLAGSLGSQLWGTSPVLSPHGCWPEASGPGPTSGRSWGLACSLAVGRACPRPLSPPQQ